MSDVVVYVSRKYKDVYNDFCKENGDDIYWDRMFNVKLNNGYIVRFIHPNDPDRLRGLTVDIVFMDETVKEEEKLILKAVQPMAQFYLGTYEIEYKSEDSCCHEWVETQGFTETYKDCKKCGMKFEDLEK